jgi:hypothetical protein
MREIPLTLAFSAAATAIRPSLALTEIPVTLFAGSGEFVRSNNVKVVPAHRTRPSTVPIQKMPSGATSRQLIPPRSKKYFGLDRVMVDQAEPFHLYGLNESATQVP